MAYNTGNAPGSSSPKDLIDNAEDFDFLLTGTGVSHPNRLGVPLKSWKGMEGEHNADQVRREAEFDADQARREAEHDADQARRESEFDADQARHEVEHDADQARRESEFDADQSARATEFSVFMEASGYSLVGDYAAGLLISRHSQYVMRSGQPYRLSSTVAVPYTTTGNWATESSKFVLLGDDTLRQALAGPAGATNVWTTGAGAGAVSRDVDDRLKDKVSAFDYMTPNQRNNVRAGLGTMDVSAAIGKAIDAGKTIELPDGAYQIGADDTVASSIFRSGISNKLILGYGAKLIKKGSTGIFSFSGCTNINILGVEFDGSLAADEAANGSILAGSRPAVKYAFAVSFLNSFRCSIAECYVHDFAWDGIVAQGTVAVGGASATLGQEIRVARNRLTNVRGTMIWTKAVQGFWFQNNIGINDLTFAQKGNFIFAVEWCSRGIISDNEGYSIGDNGIGIGEMLNNVPQAVNTAITIRDNHLLATRYHAILVAQANGCLVSGNTIEQSGAKGNMAGSSSAVLTGAITVLAGSDGVTNAQPNKNIRVTDNTIIDPYEFGIYVFDRTGTLLADSSERISVVGNTITGAGRLANASRLASGGIQTQVRRPVTIRDNRLDDITGDGIRVFGDANISDNTVSNFTGIGINVPGDTIFGNTKLSNGLRGNVCRNGKRAGIIVSGRTYVSLSDNTCRACGIDTVPGAQDATTTYLYGGIGVYQADDVTLHNNECSDNGSSGFVLRPSSTSQNRVYATDNNLSNNGAVFTVDNLRSGAYLEGNATNAVKATFINTGGTAGANQRYPIRILFGGTSTSVDGRFDTHPLAMVGATAKYTNLMTHVGRGSTGARPVLTVADIGAMYMDTTLNGGGKPIWWNGGGWVDYTGAAA